MRIVLALLLLGITVVSAEDYVVVDGGFPKAAQRLAEYREAPVVALKPGKLDELFDTLRRLEPRHVALVLPPSRIDFNFQRRFLQRATELDDDPFVDFAYGYITGADDKEALAFVETGIAADGGQRVPGLVSIAGGVERSRELSYPYPLRGRAFPVLRYLVAGKKHFPEEGRDREYVAEVLPKLRKVPAVMFIGHGWPAEIVGGPEARDLRDLRLDRSIVLNVACYTGVTGTYFERDWRAGRLLRKEVPLDESFCLGVLRSGACGYTAYLCPRPAGPELDCDLLDLMIHGRSLGEARRRDYDKTVLGFLGYGEERMRLSPLREGAPLGRVRDAVREMMLEGATGGVVFGDPALKAFKPQPELHPVRIGVRRSKGELRVEATCIAQALFLHCSDPTAKLGKSMAHKVVARVALEEGERVAGIELGKVKVGGREQAAGLVWAIEEDHGERFLHVKVNWPRGDRGDLAAGVLVRTASGGEDVAQWGRIAAQPKTVQAKGDRSETPAEVPPALLEVAGRHGVSRAALDAAIAATDAELGKGALSAAEARGRLARFGSEGFRAVCCLIEVGKHHVYTHRLLKATYSKGDEKYLIALAGMDLPNYGTWSVLEGLGVLDSKRAGQYLLERLKTERNAGNFMSAARGLAHRKERKAVRPIGEQLLRFDEGWGGVTIHLIQALAAIGDRSAARYLEKYCLDERATESTLAEDVLRNLDPKAARRVKKKRGG